MPFAPPKLWRRHFYEDELENQFVNLAIWILARGFLGIRIERGNPVFRFANRVFQEIESADENREDRVESTVDTVDRVDGGHSGRWTVDTVDMVDMVDMVDTIKREGHQIPDLSTMSTLSTCPPRPPRPPSPLLHLQLVDVMTLQIFAELRFAAQRIKIRIEL